MSNLLLIPKGCPSCKGCNVKEVKVKGITDVVAVVRSPSEPVIGVIDQYWSCLSCGVRFDLTPRNSKEMQLFPNLQDHQSIH